jgi:glutamyl-tRNA reductase
MVIGLDHRTASLTMRERFWIGEKRRYDVLRQLKCAEAIEEAVVLSTAWRTEFLLWASEPTLAANSLLQFLNAELGLRLSEWEHFYRLLDFAALSHIFRVTAGLDSLALGEPQIIEDVEAALDQARTVGAAGKFLNAVLERAIEVAQRVRRETPVRRLCVTVPGAVLMLAEQIFGSLEGKKVLLLGTGNTTELCAKEMLTNGAESVVVIDQSPAQAQDFAAKLGGKAATLADRWKCMLAADIVVSATGCPHVVLTPAEAERIATERNRVALMIIDIAMPRDVDPDVRHTDGILLYDLEGLARLAGCNSIERTAAASDAGKIVTEEALAFRSQLQAESAVPTCVALRRRLDEICRQELESFIVEHGPFSREQDQSLHAIAAQVIQKIANSLARELKDLPEKAEQEQMSAAVARLFHLNSPQQALAGTRSEKEKNEQPKASVAVH